MPVGFSQGDVNTLRAAIASGVLSVSYDGPPKRTVVYQSTDAMRAVLAQMIREVNGSASYAFAASRKGV